MKLQNTRRLSHEQSTLSWLLGATAMMAVIFSGVMAEPPTQEKIQSHDKVIGERSVFVSGATQALTVDDNANVQVKQIGAEPRLRRSVIARGHYPGYFEGYPPRPYNRFLDPLHSSFYCGTRMVGSGVIKSPSLHQPYARRARCSWTLKAAQNNVGIFIQFKQRSTVSCCYRLQISDSDGLRISLSASDSPRNFTVGPNATVNFHSYGSLSEAGFEIAFSSIPASQESTGQCFGWTEKNDSCYKLTPSSSWYKAQQLCISMNGSLADISNSDEENLLYDFLNSLGVARAWIGLNDQQVEGQWTWVSGKSVTYVNWYTGEPNDFNAREDCVEVFAEGRAGWNDNRCDRRFNGVCKRAKGQGLFNISNVGSFAAVKTDFNDAGSGDDEDR